VGLRRFRIALKTFTARFVSFNNLLNEGWNFNSGNYLFTTDTK